MTEPRKPKTSRRVRIRERMTISVSIAVSARLKAMARQRGVSASRMVEDVFSGIDFAEIYLLFEQKVPFAQVVIQTGLPPMFVREILRDYRAGEDGVPIVNGERQLPPATVRRRAAQA